MADLVTKPRRVPYASTSEEDAKDAETIEAIKADMPRIRAEAKEAAARYESGIVRHLTKTGLLNLSRLVATLTAARAANRASLDDISEATGLPVAMLADLEAHKLTDPTLNILKRYAAAVGLRLAVTAVPNAESESDGPAE